MYVMHAFMISINEVLNTTNEANMCKQKTSRAGGFLVCGQNYATVFMMRAMISGLCSAM